MSNGSSELHSRGSHLGLIRFLAKTMNITIVGSGYVGLMTEACFLQVGHHATCADKNEPKVVDADFGLVKELSTRRSSSTAATGFDRQQSKDKGWQFRTPEQFAAEQAVIKALKKEWLEQEKARRTPRKKSGTSKASAS